jgi:hypothetical protein
MFCLSIPSTKFKEHKCLVERHQFVELHLVLPLAWHLLHYSTKFKEHKCLVERHQFVELHLALQGLEIVNPMAAERKSLEVPGLVPGLHGRHAAPSSAPFSTLTAHVHRGRDGIKEVLCQNATLT